MASVAERLSAAGTANALELRGVSRLFGAMVALDDVTMSVRPGERRAVLGSNGAGKTTLFNAVTGDFPPSSGVIRFFGEDITWFPPHERIRRGLRRTYQISLLFQDMSVLDNVYLACRGVSRGRFSLLRPRRDDSLVQSALDLVEAVHLTDASPPPHGSPCEPALLTGPRGTAQRYRHIRVRGRALATDAADRESQLRITQFSRWRGGKAAVAWR